MTRGATPKRYRDQILDPDTGEVYMGTTRVTEMASLSSVPDRLVDIVAGRDLIAVASVLSGGALAVWWGATTGPVFIVMPDGTVHGAMGGVTPEGVISVRPIGEPRDEVTVMSGRDEYHILGAELQEVARRGRISRRVRLDVLR